MSSPLVVPLEEGSAPALVEPSGESGADELRRIVRHLDRCRESVLDAYDAHQLILLVRAVWAQKVWDVWIDDMSERQRTAALVFGEAPRFVELDGEGLVPLPTAAARAFIRSRGRALVAAPWAVSGPVEWEAHCWLCHRGRPCDAVEEESCSVDDRRLAAVEGEP